MSFPYFLTTLFGLAFFVFSSAPIHATGRAKYFVLVVWDGMRPDFISPELTPTLESLRDDGVWFGNHHSAFPTSTEVNGTVLATGMFPQHDGITANTEYRPDIDPLRPVGMQSLRAIRRGDELSHGKYVLVPTVAELVRNHGGRTAVAGAKPVALLHDRLERGDDTRGPVWYADGSLPASLRAALTQRLGRFPRATYPNAPRDEWTTRCLTEVFWEGELPRYSLLWLSEPDASQHRYGPGSQQALAAIHECDERLATVLSELDRRGVRKETDVFVVSDHGFSTVGEDTSVAATLRAAGINVHPNRSTPPKDGDVVVVGNGGSVMIYIAGKSPDVAAKVVTALQHQPASGVIFSREHLPGTFPLAEARMAADTAADVVVVGSWKRTPTTDGRPHVEIVNDGTAYRAGQGMHVTLSPTDLHNIAVANGPDFRHGVTDRFPSGNVDIAPTLLWLMGIKPPEKLDGRVLSEALAEPGPEVRGAEVNRLDARADLADGTWLQYLKFTELNGVRYLEEGNGHWQPAAAAHELDGAKHDAIQN